MHTALEKFDCTHLFGKKIYIVLVNSGTLHVHAQDPFKKGDRHSCLLRPNSCISKLKHIKNDKTGNQVLRSESKSSTCV